MGSITPLLDTLLHEVLGRRVYSPARRDLNTAVEPASPGNGLTTTRSDSRLHQGKGPQAGAGLAPKAFSPVTPAGRSAALSPAAAPGPAATASFSPAARAIGDILKSFPAPPSVVRPQIPLMQETVQAGPGLLAGRLESSVRDSGLFYESHLLRWYRGDLGVKQLEREPQMFMSRLATPAPPARRQVSPTPRFYTTAAPSDPVPARSSPASAAPRQSALAYQSTGRLEGPAPDKPGAAVAAERLPLVDAGSDKIPPAAGESLQGLVRHQLELLATPVLRWEGDVWSGVFMALLIQAPHLSEREHGSHQHGEETPEDEEYWHSELALNVSGLGCLQVSLRLRAEAVSLHLKTENAQMLERLESGREELAGRLRRRGVEPVIQMSVDRRAVHE